MVASILLFFNLSGSELLVIAGVVFLIFGPQKIPEIGRKAGKFMRDAKRATQDITREFSDESQNVRKELTDIKKTVNSVKDDVNPKKIIQKDISSNTKK